MSSATLENARVLVSQKISDLRVSRTSHKSGYFARSEDPTYANLTVLTAKEIETNYLPSTNTILTTSCNDFEMFESPYCLLSIEPLIY